MKWEGATTGYRQRQTASSRRGKRPQPHLVVPRALRRLFHTNLSSEWCVSCEQKYNKIWKQTGTSHDTGYKWPISENHRQGPLSGPGFGNCHQNPTAVKVVVEFKPRPIWAQVPRALFHLFGFLMPKVEIIFSNVLFSAYMTFSLNPCWHLIF